jgi:hypothetical protein
MTYDEWEASNEKELSAVSPEAYWAELAWNAALREVLKMELSFDVQTDVELLLTNIVPPKS